jgi:hypothetical protein
MIEARTPFWSMTRTARTFAFIPAYCPQGGDEQCDNQPLEAISHMAAPEPLSLLRAAATTEDGLRIHS